MLDERKAAILRAVIEEYTDTAQPVGSSAVVSAAEMRVSAATVRNEMAALESLGYLIQPHTSAGRIPTEKGYRHFVDTIDAARVSRRERRLVADYFGQMKGEIEEVLRDTAGLLTSLTDYAAVVVSGVDDGARVRSVQVVGLSERVALVVLVLSNGQLAKHTIELDEGVSDDELSAANALLLAVVEDRPITSPAELLPSGNPVVDHLAAVALSVVSGRDGRGGRASEQGRVYVDGTSRVAHAFEAVESVRRVLTILEQQLVVVSLLADVLDRGLTVAIGSETGVAPLADCSLVVSPYEVGGEHAGSIAVLGPTRMNYPQAMSAVAAVSRQLGTRLSEG